MVFDTISYLEAGNERQKLAYSVLTGNKVFDKLRLFDPLLVGTIPIDIDIESSDLDVICYWTVKDDFIKTVIAAFSHEKSFSIKETNKFEHETVIAKCVIGDFEIEIFGQNIPSRQQRAYQHMIIEHEILKIKGEKFRQQVIELKKQGYKTEPAFGHLLNLKGDPYEELLKYKIVNDSL